MATLEAELGVNPPAAIVAVAERLRSDAPPPETGSQLLGSTSADSAGVPSGPARPAWRRRVTAATVALIARLGGRRRLLRWSTAAAAVAALAAAGLFVRAEVRRSRSLGDVAEERRSTLGPRPANLREPVLLVFMPPSTGDSVVDAALRRSFSISEYLMARTFPGRIVGTDSVAALLRAIRARTKVAVTENEELHELLRVTGAAAAVGVNTMLYNDSIRINNWIARRTTYRDHRMVMRPVERLPGPPGERGIWVREDPMRLVPFGPPIDGLEKVHLAGIVLPATALPLQVWRAENDPLFRILTSMTTCERRLLERPAGPEGFRSPWCWRWWGKLQLADDDGHGYTLTRSRGIPAAPVPLSTRQAGR
jgi:hypothetical protein